MNMEYRYKEQIVYEVIPRIKQMYQNEKDHLEYLIESKEKLIKKSKKFYYIVLQSNLDVLDIMIEKSKKILLSLEKRLEEYCIYELCYIKKEQLN